MKPERKRPAGEVGSPSFRRTDAKKQKRSLTPLLDMRREVTALALGLKEVLPLGVCCGMHLYGRIEALDPHRGGFATRFHVRADNSDFVGATKTTGWENVDLLWQGAELVAVSQCADNRPFSRQVRTHRCIVDTAAWLRWQQDVRDAREWARMYPKASVWMSRASVCEYAAPAVVVKFSLVSLRDVDHWNIKPVLAGSVVIKPCDCDRSQYQCALGCAAFAVRFSDVVCVVIGAMASEWLTNLLPEVLTHLIVEYLGLHGEHWATDAPLAIHRVD